MRPVPPDIRFPGLAAEHREGLALARRLAAAPRRSVDLALVELAEHALATQLEPHFRVEEELLLPALAWAGGQTLAGRVLREHAALRAHVAAARASPRRILEFARLLEDHIRFEESELFEASERLLSPQDLERLAVARPRAVAGEG